MKLSQFFHIGQGYFKRELAAKRLCVHPSVCLFFCLSKWLIVSLSVCLYFSFIYLFVVSGLLWKIPVVVLFGFLLFFFSERYFPGSMLHYWYYPRSGIQDHKLSFVYKTPEVQCVCSKPVIFPSWPTDENWWLKINRSVDINWNYCYSIIETLFKWWIFGKAQSFHKCRIINPLTPGDF